MTAPATGPYGALSDDERDLMTTAFGCPTTNDAALVQGLLARLNDPNYSQESAVTNPRDIPQVQAGRVTLFTEPDSLGRYSLCTPTGTADLAVDELRVLQEGIAAVLARPCDFEHPRPEHPCGKPTDLDPCSYCPHDLTEHGSDGCDHCDCCAPA